MHAHARALMHESALRNTSCARNEFFFLFISLFLFLPVTPRIFNSPLLRAIVVIKGEIDFRKIVCRLLRFFLPLFGFNYL